MSISLPDVGSTIVITGRHPWAGSRATVLAHEEIGALGITMAECSIIRQDAMNGHRCYVDHTHWRLEGSTRTTPRGFKPAGFRKGR